MNNCVPLNFEPLIVHLFIYLKEGDLRSIGFHLFLATLVATVVTFVCFNLCLFSDLLVNLVVRCGGWLRNVGDFGVNVVGQGERGIE